VKAIPVGTKVFIRAKESWANGEWGIVRSFDGNDYHVAIAGGQESLVFSRTELVVRGDKKVTKEARIMKRIPRNVIEAIQAVAGGDSALDVAGVLTNPQQEWPEGTSMFVPNRINQREEAPAGDLVPGQKDTGPKDSAGGGGTSRKENDLEGAL
jgi:hypothetical protein